MLNSLSYSVTFPSTGRRLAADIDFQSGFGSITGPNEAGKTFVIEMVRYCLFGTAALRHKAESYKDLTASLTFTIRGVQYTVHRDRKPRMLEGDDVIAVGTSPVTAKVVEKLGYGLDVFDVANVANQGDLEKLGQMRPGDRKRMVDNVIGLGVIENLTKWCGDQALGFHREAEAIASVLRQPSEPVKPERMVTVEEVSAIEALQSELDRLNGWLSNHMEEAIAPAPDGSNLSTEELAELARRERELRAELTMVRKLIRALPEPSPHSDVDLNDMLVAHDRADEWDAWNRLPLREASIAELEQMSADWDLIAAHIHRDRAQRQYDKADHHQCPACSHRFPSDPEWVAELEAQLVDLAPRPTEPSLSPSVIRDQLQILDRPAEPIRVDRPVLSRKDVIAAQAANQRANERAKLEAKILELEAIPYEDHEAAYSARQRYEAAFDAYQQHVAVYGAWAKERDAKLLRRDELLPLVQKLPELRQLLAQAQAYERDINRFLQEVADYAHDKVRVEHLRDQADGWRKAKTSMATLRLLVKQHLLPSLNKVASHLITGMTGGQRRSIVVDDEFEVTVDGQPLDTLSGSGKSVSNLALRLGLGQVLTNNVFSVFIGDEIDAFMDADRAENTANTLRLLQVSISQILLVTHKYPAADFYIDLGTNEQRQSN